MLLKIQEQKKLYDVHGNEAFTEKQRQNWFARLRSGDSSFKESFKIKAVKVK